MEMLFQLLILHILLEVELVLVEQQLATQNNSHQLIVEVLEKFLQRLQMDIDGSLLNEEVDEELLHL
jgi:hypothetical protein